MAGLRVVLVQLDLAIVHACVAQAFLCLVTLMSVVTSRWWLDAPDLSSTTGARRLIGLAAASALAIYLQLMVGATMRHYQAGLAIPDLPLAYGHLLPPTDQAGLDAANAMRLADPTLQGKTDLQTTLGQIWLHFGHRVGAVLVTILLIALIVQVFRHEKDKVLTRPAGWLIVLLIAQLTLGVLTVLWRKPADIASTHVAVGALVLLTTFVVLIRSMRLYSPSWRSSSLRREIEVSNLTPNPHAVPA